jgi:hypothetical protein
MGRIDLLLMVFYKSNVPDGPIEFLFIEPNLFIFARINFLNY